MSLPTDGDKADFDYIDAALALVFETPLAPRDDWPGPKLQYDHCLRTGKSFLTMLKSLDDFMDIKDKDFRPFVLALDYLFFRNDIFQSTSIHNTKFALFWSFIRDLNVTYRGSVCLWEPGDFHGSGFKLWLNVARLETPLAFVSTLLHEMSHMYISSLRRHVELDGMNVRKHLVGVTNHGYYWQRLARDVESKTREIIDKRIDLNCFDALLRERHESGIEPSQAYYQKIYGNLKGKGGRPVAELAQEFVEQWYPVVLNMEALEELPFPESGE